MALKSSAMRVFGVSLILPPSWNDCQSFINENSEEPAAKCAFVFEARRMARSRAPTVFDSIVSLFGPTKNTTCNEVKQPVTPRESDSEY
jgi:hypothetical protein